MRRLAGLALFCLLAIAALGLLANFRSGALTLGAAQTPNGASQADGSALSSRGLETQAALHVSGYTLPPDIYAKARSLNRIGYVARVVVPLYSILVLYWLLRWGWAAKFRDWAEALSSRRFLQAAIFSAVFFTVLALFELPFDAAEHWLLRRYDLVVQGWGSWLGDQAKSLLVTVVIGLILVAIFFAIVRRSARRWWFYFWLASVPILVFVIFLTPMVIDPLFNKFEPLADHDPLLVNDLERVVQRAGLEIPPERMYLMKASEKVKLLNAYVTGLGASKRVVIWDTTIAKMTRPQILFVFGHEMGHYVLNHIYKGMVFYAFAFLVFLYLSARISRGWLERFSGAWKIRGAADWAALPVYAIPILLLNFIATPLINGFSRYYEHQADQYGLEVTHGITRDSGQIAAQSFQILGEIDMEDPAPNRLEILWYWDHPWIGDRIQFALHYDPWSKGETGEFVK